MFKFLVIIFPRKGKEYRIAVFSYSQGRAEYEAKKAYGKKFPKLRIGKIKSQEVGVLTQTDCHLKLNGGRYTWIQRPKKVRVKLV